MLVAIDPGKKCLGWAGFRRERLVKAAAPKCVERVGPWIVAAQLTMDIEIGCAAAVVLECMHWRPNDSSSQPNDLLDVQLVGALVAASLGVVVGVYKASEWKGNTPKKIHHPRISAALYTHEIGILREALTCTPKAHHKEILDAIGIGLFHLGRIDKRGVVI